MEVHTCLQSPPNLRQRPRRARDEGLLPAMLPDLAPREAAVADLSGDFQLDRLVLEEGGARTVRSIGDAGVAGAARGAEGVQGPALGAAVPGAGGGARPAAHRGAGRDFRARPWDLL